MGELIIVGSGVAGHRAAVEIGRLAPERRVIMIGGETGLPYDRPPLSKEFLMADEANVPRLGPPGLYGQNITLRDGTLVTRVDRTSRTVSLSNGDILPYDKLLLATGSNLRRLPLPGIDPARVLYLRTLDDARKLRDALRTGRRFAIIGGGFIGLEVAAAARTMGCPATVLEVAASLLSRGATPTLGGYLQGLHAGHGVDVVLNARIAETVETTEGVILRWAGGEMVADFVVVGIGVQPNTALAAEAGLAVDNGIVVDQSGRTSDPSVFAAGEVTSYPIGRTSRRMRTESWSAASLQGEVAARAMLGRDDPFIELPWFWSDQYDTNVQCLGLPTMTERFMQIGAPDSAKWMRIGVDAEGALVGAEAVNMGREMSALRRADRTGQPIPKMLIDMADSHGERLEQKTRGLRSTLEAGIK